MLLARTRVMSIPEFLQECERERWERENNITKLDKMIGHIKRNKKMYQRLVAMIAIVLFVINLDLSMAYAIDVDEAVGIINNIFEKLFKIAQALGSGLNAVYAIKGIVNELLKGNMNISKPVLAYLWIQLALYFLPELGELIASIANSN